MLRHRSYRFVWFGAAGSSIGTWMETVGVQWIVARETGSTVMMGVLAAAQLGPLLLLSIFGGIVADRCDRRLVLQLSQGVMMLIAATLMVASWTGNATPGVLIALMLLHGTAMAFRIPAWQTLTPNLVPRSELQSAIALNSLQFNAARVIGPALGGVLMAWQGPTVLFAINTLSYVWAIAMLLPLPAMPANRDEHADGETGFIAETRQAMRFVFGSIGPRRVLFGLLAASVLAGPLLRMLPLFVSEVYEMKETAYGTLLAIMGVGAVLGSVLLHRVPEWYPRHHLIPCAIFVLGASITAFAIAPSFAIAAPLLLVIGWFWMWSFAVSITAMQLLVADSMRGRVMAVVNTVVFGAMPLGSLAAGLAGETIARLTGHSAQGALAVQAGVSLLAVTLAGAGVVMITFRTPEIDGIGDGEPGFRRTPGLRSGITARAHRPSPPVPRQGVAS